MRSALQKRIVLGLVMIAVLCGLFWLDWRLEQITQHRALRAAREGLPMPWPAWPPVGLPIAVRDAHPEILGSAAYRTRSEGGRGVVREVCDLFERAFASASPEDDA